MKLNAAIWIRTATMSVVLALATFAAVAAPGAAAAAQQVEGHYGSASERAEGSNPSIGGKMIGYVAYTKANRRAPDVLILGTSRAMQLDPREIKKRSGKSAYNASVSDGAARELLAFGSFAELVTPERAPHLVIMFDIEGLDGRTPTRRVESTIAATEAARKSCPSAERCTTVWKNAAAAIVRDSAVGLRGRPAWSLMQRPDGLIRSPSLARMEREGVDLIGVRDRRIAIRIKSYRPGGAFDALEAAPKAKIKRLLQLANARGDSPSLVITSMHPECIRRCGPAGWFEHRRNARLFLRGLAKTYDFQIHDYSDPKAWGGTAASFYDEIHLRPKAAAQVVAKLDSEGAFDIDPTADPDPETAASASTSTSESTPVGFFERGLAQVREVVAAATARSERA
ncbi:MAG: hypothetical protein JWM25_216 [Thermoleophilia bacterium]|nr:hypothetical protein [Thermoleophilia bacterium]